MTDHQTGPLGERPQVLARDPEAHRKLDELAEAIKTILAWIQGDQMRGIPGMAAEHRKHSERLDTMEERVERHAKRIYELEQAGSRRVQWTLKTLAERLVTLGAAAIAGWVASLFANRPHP